MLNPGIIIEATHRSQDILPVLLDTFSSVDSQAAGTYHYELVTLGFEEDFMGAFLSEDSPVWENESETIAAIIEELLDALQEYVPKGYYLGMQEGDGACLGVFPIED